jgi:hypothetical protein
VNRATGMPVGTTGDSVARQRNTRSSGAAREGECAVTKQATAPRRNIGLSSLEATRVAARHRRRRDGPSASAARSDPSPRPGARTTHHTFARRASRDGLASTIAVNPAKNRRACGLFRVGPVSADNPERNVLEASVDEVSPAAGGLVPKPRRALPPTGSAEPARLRRLSYRHPPARPPHREREPLCGFERGIRTPGDRGRPAPVP